MRVLLLLTCFLISSCGYQFQSGSTSTIAIPFIEGDERGLLTSTLIEKFSSSSSCQYQMNDPDYILVARIAGINNKQIGYRKDRYDDNKRKKKVRQVEGRQKVVVEVCVKDRRSNLVIFGPTNIESDVDYDYIDQDTLPELLFTNGQGASQTSLSFSLGQLEAINSAQQAALRPLFQSVASKIVDHVSGCIDEEKRVRENF